MNAGLGKLKVMVVEDSKVAVKAITGYLEEMNAIPLVAVTGNEAVEMYRRERPDIVLLDVILPDIDGFEVAAQIRKLQSKHQWTAIIFLTVMSKDEDMARGIEVGGDDYLMKPVSRVVLQSKLAAMTRLVNMQRELVRVTEKLNNANLELQRLSMTDGLTGLANRRFLNETLVREWRRCLRLKKSMSVVMIDVDFFKKYNDGYGHQMGDDCLKRVAGEVARAAPRPGDLAARYGGEEFMLVLGETEEDGARWVAQRIAQHVMGLRLTHEDSPHGIVTVSCGVSSVYPGDDKTVEQLVKAADAALYVAKQEGRNAVRYLDYGKAN